ncbi:hypothetical protein [Azospirillum doebereinerae]
MRRSPTRQGPSGETLLPFRRSRPARHYFTGRPDGGGGRAFPPVSAIWE